MPNKSTPIKVIRFDQSDWADAVGGTTEYTQLAKAYKEQNYPKDKWEAVKKAVHSTSAKK